MASSSVSGEDHQLIMPAHSIINNALQRALGGASLLTPALPALLWVPFVVGEEGDHRTSS